MFGKGFGWPEIVLILLIILIFFGVGKLPQVGESLGKGIRAFRRAQQVDDDKETKPAKTEPAKEEKKES